MPKHIYDKEGNYKGKILSDKEHQRTQNTETSSTERKCRYCDKELLIKINSTYIGRGSNWEIDDERDYEKTLGIRAIKEQYACLACYQKPIEEREIILDKKLGRKSPFWNFMRILVVIGFFVVIGIFIWIIFFL